MKKSFILILSIFFMLSAKSNRLFDKGNMKVSMKNQEKPVVKKVLNNGMTILVRPVAHIPKVSVQLWYNVGSKDEKSGEKGIAHLIEHMIFKGTKRLSESDINVITHKLSGNCNAFTSYDYTGYLFNFPKQNWEESLNIMSDCMKNCTFKEDMLSSEMKAVIQELKMYRDHYTSSLLENMISTIFEDHPYHYPIIGYKQDLWSVHSDDLKDFYKKHYHPNNATLVVVGDVDPNHVFKLAEKYFGDIPADKEYKKEELYHNKDIVSKSVTLYRDIKQPLIAYAFAVPGVYAKKDHLLELLTWVIGKGKGSRLYKKLVDNLQLATSVNAYSEELFEHGLFFILVEPKDIQDIPKIEQIIKDEIADIVHNGIKSNELERAIKQTEMGLYGLLESFENQAYQIGKYFLATNDENYIFNYLNQSPQELQREIHELMTMYFRPAVMHSGKILPLPQSEKTAWAELQKESDTEDNRILAAHVRNTSIEPPRYANQIHPNKEGMFDFPKPEIITLSNGLKVMFYNNPNTPKIDAILRLKAQYFYDPEDMQGLYNFMASMLSEGTKNYTAEELADIMEERGMLLGASAGVVSTRMLTDDFEFGMNMLQEILSHPTFSEKEIEKVRTQQLASIINYWDEPSDFAGQLLRNAIYKGHPYSKNSLGTQETVKKITRKDIIDAYKKYITPHDATLAIVGDLDKYNVKEILEKTIGKWHGEEATTIEFPQVKKVEEEIVTYPINRDQVVLCLANLTVDRKNPDYDKFLLFDQIFGGGSLGSMSSRLFQLREQSGLFYTINGSLIAGADEQPGMFLVKTIVSLDRLAEAEKVIKQTIDSITDTITPHELDEAKRAITNSLVNRFASNRGTAAAFLLLDKYNFAPDFFDKRAEQINKITLDEIKHAVKKVLNSKELLTLRIGRVEKEKTA